MSSVFVNSIALIGSREQPAKSEVSSFPTKEASAPARGDTVGGDP